MSAVFYRIYNECSCCARGDQEEIGLLSSGWKFLFQKGGLSYWLKRLETGYIKDEAGRTVTIENFTRLVQAQQAGTSNKSCRGIRGLRTDPEGFEYIR